VPIARSYRYGLGARSRGWAKGDWAINISRVDGHSEPGPTLPPVPCQSVSRRATIPTQSCSVDGTDLGAMVGWFRR
jgi:hypothetical protein